MGMIENILGAIFGGGRNVLAETAGVFRENSEAGAQRQAEYAQAALAQYTAEFQVERKGWFDRFMDGFNRLPRPMMVLGIFGLFLSAMFNPLWFAERMQGLALVPDPLWVMNGLIVTFYFGGRFQIKSQEFRKSVNETVAMVPQVMENIEHLRKMRHDSPGIADTGTDAGLSVSAIEPSDNPAISAWRERAKND